MELAGWRDVEERLICKRIDSSNEPHESDEQANALLWVGVNTLFGSSANQRIFRDPALLVQERFVARK